MKGLGAVNFLGEDPGLAALYDLALLSTIVRMFDSFFHAVAMILSELSYRRTLVK
ncbi:hypothetical protein U9M73_14490 [Paenibacillus phoenicis]|uniref:Uncharacterized protein n=1 Tax=Paenibacillus phoenicis TaxID=554117 RepID=A0ABU5PMK0_9BACL|nr:hypothetical protein [Paenibacillus phoenicis]MEA3571178.1 hypothetical protein [Paenibacillus phoenicis]